MPVVGHATHEDVAPEAIHLDQVHVDSEIAKMISVEEHDNLMICKSIEQATALTSIPDDNLQPSPE